MISPICVPYLFFQNSTFDKRNAAGKKYIHIYCIHTHTFIYLEHKQWKQRLHDERGTQIYGHLLLLPGKTKAI